MLDFLLQQIQARLESRIVGVSVEPKVIIGKLFISKDNALVKLEVNLVGRGTYKEPKKIILCERTQVKSLVSCNDFYKGLPLLGNPL